MINFKNTFRIIASGIIVFSLAIFSCSNEDTTGTTADTTDGELASKGEVVIEDGLNISNDAADDVANPNGGRTKACTAASVNTSNKTITLDFGTDGCSGADGRLRKGKITITYLGADIKTSTSRTITFINYSVNSNSLNGSITQTTMQRPTATSFSFSISASNLNLVLSDGETYVLSNFLRSFLYDYGDPKVVTDDVVTATGSSTQTSSSGTVTTLNIIAPIKFNGSCASTGFYYPVSGSYEFLNGNLKYTIDWGTGTCDKDITISVFGKTAIKTLP